MLQQDFGNWEMVPEVRGFARLRQVIEVLPEALTLIGLVLLLTVVDRLQAKISFITDSLPKLAAKNKPRRETVPGLSEAGRTTVSRISTVHGAN
jgi:hypothetical protein